MDDINESTWNAGIIRALLALMDEIRKAHGFLMIVCGGNPAILNELRAVEERYCWLIKVASGLSSGEVTA